MPRNRAGRLRGGAPPVVTDVLDIGIEGTSTNCNVRLITSPPPQRFRRNGPSACCLSNLGIGAGTGGGNGYVKLRQMCRPVLASLFMAMILGLPLDAGAQSTESVGTRAQGMGGAFVGVADDASAVYWNPAGLAGGAYFSLVARREHRSICARRRARGCRQERLDPGAQHARARAVLHAPADARPFAPPSAFRKTRASNPW